MRSWSVYLINLLEERNRVSEKEEHITRAHLLRLTTQVPARILN